MKNFSCLFLVAGALLSASTWAAKSTLPQEPHHQPKHAVEISLTGKGAGVDSLPYNQVRRVIGDAVAGGVADKFIVLGYAQKGGFSACVEDNASQRKFAKFSPIKTRHDTMANSMANLRKFAEFRTAPNFSQFVAKLKKIKVNVKTTTYTVNWVAGCTDPVDKPATVRIAKSDGGLQCQNNGISLAEMQKQLGDIKVYSASKENDGQMRVTLCGVDAGNFNVYEIAQTDLSAAIALGFSEWTQSADN